MATRHAARLWAIGGAFAAAAIVAGGWFLAVGPQRAETQALEEQAASAQTRVTVLQQRLADLREQQSKLPEYEADLAKNRKALPATSGVPDFLRELQAAGEEVGVSVDSVVVDEPAEVDGATTKIYRLPISINATGKPAALDRFLDQLQRERDRAVLIRTVNAEATDPKGSLANGATLRLSLDAFVAPNIGAK
jgi:type IV pilus assembly protein PilO